MGYHRAGFDVVGVDIKPQPHYPFECHQGDAFEWLKDPALRHHEVWNAIHASPPCQPYSTTRSLHSNAYPALIEATRDHLRRTGLPYVMENVMGAPLLKQSSFGIPDAAGVLLCGSSFGLGVRRHRLFETNFPLVGLVHRHNLQPEPIDVTGGGPSKEPRLDGRGGRSRKPKNLAEAKQAMGIDWPITRAEINEAIPPAYTQFIGEQLLEHLARVA